MSGPASTLTIGQVAERTGVATSALRYYEELGLISSERSDNNQRVFSRDAIRRVSFIRIAQELGLSLDEIRESIASLPAGRTPNEDDWHRLSTEWRPRIDAQIGRLERLRDRLDACIGCGCLSLKLCRIVNPGDAAGDHGPGARYVIDDTTVPITTGDTT